MNKKTLRTAVLSALSLFLSSSFAHAQYNKNYSVPRTAEDVVACANGEYCTVSSITGFRRYDYNGNLLWERTYSNLPMHVGDYWGRLVHTDDDGIIFFTVGQYYNPMAIKIDIGGNLVWAKEYLSNSDSVNLDAGLRIDATHMENASSEGYMMVTSGHTGYVDYRDNLAPYRYRSVLNVLRIDGDGNLVWNKKYAEDISDAYSVNDLANTISYSGRDDFGNNSYYIGGLRNQNPISPTDPGGSFYFQMSIDENGNIVNDYQALTACSYPTGFDSEYDWDDNTVAVTFQFAACPQAGPGIASQIGLIKVDHSLNMTMQKFYWFPSCNEVVPHRIQKSQIDGSYLIAGQAADQGTLSQSIINFFLIKVRPDGTSLFSKRYMVAENGYANGLIVNYNPSLHDENYVMIGASGPYNSTTIGYGRILSTDHNGVVCGQWDFPLEDGNASLPTASYHYSSYDVYGQNDYNIPEIQPYVTGYHDCNFYHESGYRTIPASVAQTDAQCKVYPSVLSENENNLSVDVTLSAASNLSIVVYSIDGRKITEQQYHDVSIGKLKVSLGGLLPGNYLVNIQSDNKEIRNTTRFSKL
ncbi:T9SS type A sorting domain-containing protein [Taibaiella soli]|uniref:Secretion system C-terminal sorting domain-containing protein n=1 Tax=Taibaiella soli TaxID=1649169 RepID=A0A2W2B1R9_9BACT|nr:T9SS type A sorting domain-containing protein [Taibaiella soli]PZF74204.1 hypothetical protein DN068_04080 [Taibaiella soli]